VAPAQTMPNDITVQADDSTGATVTYPAPGVTDDEDPAPTTSCAPASGSRFPVGTTTVTCTARDASGNESHGTFTVTVTQKPIQETPPQGEIPAPPAPAGGTGDTPLPPAPPSANSGDPGSGRSPTLDTVDRLAPKLAGLQLRAGRHSLRLNFKLSEPATVTVAINRRGSKRVLKRVKTTLGKGSRSVTLRSAKLGAGRYTLEITAVDSAGNARHVTRAVTLRR
jgi:hypothetical protein